MHRKQLYLDTPIWFFFNERTKISKIFTLKLIIRIIMIIWSKISSDLTKIKALLWYQQVKLVIILMVSQYIQHCTYVSNNPYLVDQIYQQTH
jgi:uncharacterized membrane protein YGL010W